MILRISLDILSGSSHAMRNGSRGTGRTCAGARDTRTGQATFRNCSSSSRSAALSVAPFLNVSGLSVMNSSWASQIRVSLLLTVECNLLAGHDPICSPVSVAGPMHVENLLLAYTEDRIPSVAGRAMPLVVFSAWHCTCGTFIAFWHHAEVAHAAAAFLGRFAELTAQTRGSASSSQHPCRSRSCDAHRGPDAFTSQACAACVTCRSRALGLASCMHRSCLGGALACYFCEGQTNLGQHSRPPHRSLLFLAWFLREVSARRGRSESRMPALPRRHQTMLGREHQNEARPESRVGPSRPTVGPESDRDLVSASQATWWSSPTSADACFAPMSVHVRVGPSQTQLGATNDIQLASAAAKHVMSF